YLGLLALLYFELSYPLMIVAVVIAMFVVGALFERITLATVRGRRYAKNPEADLVPMVVATIGLGYLLKGAVRVVPYTEEARPPLAPRVPGPPIFIGDVVLQRQDVAIIAATDVVMAALIVFFGWTATGKALRATSLNPRAAALIGIPVRSMRMIAWGLAAGL